MPRIDTLGPLGLVGLALLLATGPASATEPCRQLAPLQLAPDPPGESIDLESSGLDLELAMSSLSTRALVTSGLANEAARLDEGRLVVMARRCSRRHCELVLALFEGRALRQTRLLRTGLTPELDLAQAAVRVVDFEGDGRNNLLATWLEPGPARSGPILRMQAFYPELSPLSPLITPRQGAHERVLTLVPGCSRRHTLAIERPGLPPQHLAWPLKRSP